MSVNVAKDSKFDDTAFNFQLLFDKYFAKTEEVFLHTFFLT